jgi:hypothetical protein
MWMHGMTSIAAEINVYYHTLVQRSPYRGHRAATGLASTPSLGVAWMVSGAGVLEQILLSHPGSADTKLRPRAKLGKTSKQC